MTHKIKVKFELEKKVKIWREKSKKAKTEKLKKTIEHCVVWKSRQDKYKNRQTEDKLIL